MPERESWHNVGKRIRQLRKANQLTLRQLADGCDLSTNAISLVERGEVAPTVATLCKIAHALGVSAGVFFQDICSSGVLLERARSQQAAADLNQVLASLTQDMPLSEYAARLQILRGKTCCGSLNPVSQMVLCVCGRIVFEIDDDRYLLEAGDSLTFNGEAPHCWANPGRQTGVAIMLLPSLAVTQDQEGD